MVQFKCLHTGNLVQFEAEHDIQTMRKHSEYAEVLAEEKKEVKEEPVKIARKFKGQ